jgi:uncharacterized protein YggT (Ycf19 family)
MSHLSNSLWDLLDIFVGVLLVRGAGSFFPPRGPGLWSWMCRTSEVATDPLLEPVQARVPLWGGLDMSPLLALLGALIAVWIGTALLGFVGQFKF